MLTAPASNRASLPVVLTGDVDSAHELRDRLSATESGFELLACVTDVREAVESLRNPRVCAVLHVASQMSGTTDDAATSLKGDVAAIRRQTNAPIILLPSSTEPMLVEAALAAGVDDVVVAPQPETIAFAIHKAAQSRRAASEHAGGGEVITVFSPKGGTGKTVMSTNIAAYLAAKTPKRVLLIDLDLQFGDAAIMLGLDPKRTMTELVQSAGELDTGKLDAYVTKHRSGLDVLAAPLLPEQADLVTEAKVLRLVEVAREAYDLVVIDTSPFFYGPMMALLGPTDHLLLLCGLDVPTLKNVRLSLRTLDLLGFPSERTNLVLNRVTPSVGLTADDVREALGVKVAFEIPNDPVVAPSVNRGMVPALSESDSEFARALAQIADSIQPTLVTPLVAHTTHERSAPLFRRFVPRRALEGRV